MEVTAGSDSIRAGSQTIKMLAERDPAALPWRELGVDVVIESTGRFTKAADARKHLEAGARQRINAAPAYGGAAPLCVGANHLPPDAARHATTLTTSPNTNSTDPPLRVLA